MTEKGESKNKDLEIRKITKEDNNNNKKTREEERREGCNAEYSSFMQI
jgi:hypothetical protein